MSVAGESGCRTTLQLARYQLASQAVLLLALLSLFSTPLWAGEKQNWGKVSDEEIAYIPVDKYADEGAVILFEQGELEIPQPYEDNYVHLKHYRRCKILDVNNAEDAITVEIYFRSNDKVKDLKAETISADGKRKTEVDKNDFHKQTTDDYEIITFTFPAVEPGCFVEFKYELRHRRFLSLSPWYFQNPLLTKESYFSVVVHKGFEYSVAMRNIPLEMQEPERSSLYIWNEKCAEYIWDLKDLPPVREEPFMPAVRDYRAALSFQLKEYSDQYNVIKFATQWSSLGEEFEELLNSFVDDKGDIKDTTKAVLAEFDGGSGLDTLKYLYRHIRDNYETETSSALYYIDFNDTKDLLEKKKGTSAGKNQLLIEMLRSAGIDAKPLLIGTRDYCKFDPQVYHMSRFNYLLCLATVDGETYFLDTRDKYAAFPFLPPECMAGGGLLIDGEDSKPVQLTHPKRVSAVTAQARLYIGNDGAAVCSTHVNLRGHYLSIYRNLLDEDIDEGNVKSSLIENADDVKLDVNTAMVTDFGEDDSVTVDLVVDLPDFCETIENNLVFEPLLYVPRVNPFEKAERTYPVDFRFEHSFYVTTDVTVGDSLTIVSMPEQVREAANGIQFNRSTFGGGNSMRVVSQMIVNKKVFEAGEYPTLRAVYEKIAQAGLERAAAEFISTSTDPDPASEPASAN